MDGEPVGNVVEAVELVVSAGVECFCEEVVVELD